MSQFEVPGSFESIYGASNIERHYPDKDYLDGWYDHSTVMLADTDVDSFEDPRAPSIPAGNKTIWALQLFYTNTPEVVDEYDSYEYGLITNDLHVSLDYGDSRFDNDIEVTHPTPNEDDADNYTDMKLSVTSSLGPISVGPAISLYPGSDEVNVDHKPKQYVEWDMTHHGFPDSQEDAAGVAFDIEGGTSYTTSTFSAEWSCWFSLVEFAAEAREPYNAFYSRQDGDSFEFDVDIVPDN